MGDEVENVDYNELVDKIIKDCGMQDLCDDVKKLSAELLEDRAITRQRFHTIMELINRVDTRLDQHMENQATAPIREVNELKNWLKDYMDNYVIKTNEKLNSSEEKIKRHESEIFGNGKKLFVWKLNL
jgi:hypothetical protein